MLHPIQWTGQAVRLLDQTRLPTETVFVEITDERQMWDAIRRLVVRGAPLIGIAAAFGAYLGVRGFHGDDAAFRTKLKEVCDYLATSRPTAVNLFWALERIQRVARDLPSVGAASADQLPRSNESPRSAEAAPTQPPARVLDECLLMIDEDQRTCRAIGEHGCEMLASIRANPIGILTHCNAGRLVTAGIGTALAPVYVAVERGLHVHVYSDETRPLLQGSRITAFELKEAGVPVTVICDNMAATVMRQKKVQAVIVGADRIAANGDTANKIGTFGVAILARHFGIPFYVAAPMSTVDASIKTGAQIPIEERDPREITHGFARQTAPDGVKAYNPAFDVTPAELISAIVTEKGIITPPFAPGLAATPRVPLG